MVRWVVGGPDMAFSAVLRWGKSSLRRFIGVIGEIIAIRYRESNVTQSMILLLLNRRLRNDLILMKRLVNLKNAKVELNECASVKKQKSLVRVENCTTVLELESS